MARNDGFKAPELGLLASADPAASGSGLARRLQVEKSSLNGQDIFWK